MSDFLYEAKLLSEFEAVDEIFEHELKKVRAAQLNEITKTIHSLYLVEVAPKKYREHSKDVEYSTFENELRKSIEERQSSMSFGWWDIKSDTGMDIIRRSVAAKSIDNRITDVMKSFLSIDYTPPEEWGDIIFHLSCLYLCYGLHLNVPQTLINIRLGFSLCKLIGAANRMYAIAKIKGERELRRLIKSAQKLDSKTRTMDDHISKIFFVTDEIRKDMKLHTVAKIIRNKFEEYIDAKKITVTRPPSLDTIKKYLMSNEKISSTFAGWKK